MMSVREHYDPATRWGRDYGYRDPIYTLGYHRGQDIRKTDPTGSYSIVSDIVSLSGGVVSHVYTSRQTGREIVVDTGRARGRYEIHCHTADRVPIGTEVRAGYRIARNAKADESPGTSWGGPHDHFVISDYPDAGHNTARSVYDPRPFIRNALATTASDTPRPFPQPENDQPAPAEEEDDMPKNTGIATQRESDKVWFYLIFNYGSGIGHQFTSGSDKPLPGEEVNGLATTFETPPWKKVSQSHFNRIAASLNDVQPI